jgi:hypothetical protein
MPLYELIIIGRCSASKGTANLMRLISIAILKAGGDLKLTFNKGLGNVRDLNLLGDRVLTKNVQGKDQKRHILGRYMQVNS